MYHFLNFVRFDISGVHPQSKMPGTYTQVPYCKKATTIEVHIARVRNSKNQCQLIQVFSGAIDSPKW